MASTTASPPDLIDEIVVERIPMSYDEYVAWCAQAEGNRGEWVDGEVIPFMTTSDRHQRMLTFLFGLLVNYLDLTIGGRVYSQTFEMRSRPGAAREPDLMVVFDSNRNRVERVRLRGPADLAVEIISPDSVTRDRRLKLAEYEAAGVPEYWVVDPREGRERMELFVLATNGKYHPVEPDHEGRLLSTVLPGVWCDPTWLLGDELPSVVRLSLEMAGLGPLPGPR